MEVDYGVYLEPCCAPEAPPCLPSPVTGGLPTGFPQAAPGAMAWKAEDIRYEDYVHDFFDEEVFELENALRSFKELGLDGDQIGRHNFPLPKLQHRLDTMARDLHKGRGFFLLRGLEPTDYSVEDNLLLFLGISSYIGPRLGRQDSKGNMISGNSASTTGALADILNTAHVTDSKASTVPRVQRHGIDSNVDLPFHNEIICDILALQTRQCATRGGSSLLSSSGTVYTELAASRPDLIHVLSKPDWPFKNPGGTPPYFLRPLLFHSDGQIILNFDSGPLQPVKWPTSHKGGPELSNVQLEALDVVFALAQKHHLQITTRPGDLQYINNLGLLHARQAFEDDQQSSRHVVRLWLRNDELGWRIPEELSASWDKVFRDDGRERKFPIEALPIYTAPKYATGSGIAVWFCDM